MKVIYRKWYNSYYDLELGNEYDAQQYEDGWLMIDGVLYREEHFEVVQSHK